MTDLAPDTATHAPAEPLVEKVERHHWVNVLVGVLDSAFHLTDQEQAATAAIVHKLLTNLHVPGRGTPVNLPIPVVQEMHSNLYSLQLESTRRAATPREVRGTTSHDSVVTIEAWREALESMLLSAYPNLRAEERIIMAKVFTDLLAAIGVPNRAAAHFPPSVVAAHNKLDF